MAQGQAPNHAELYNRSKLGLSLGGVLPTYDKSRWPIFGVTMPARAMLEHEFATHLETLGNLLATERRFALLVDARGAHPLNAKQRAAVASLHRQALDRDAEVIVGIAVILSSALERGILTAINWAAGSTLPSQPFATTEEGVAWLGVRLSQATKTVPPLVSGAALERDATED